MKHMLLVQALWTGILVFLSAVYLGYELLFQWLKFIVIVGILLGGMYYVSYERKNN